MTSESSVLAVAQAAKAASVELASSSDDLRKHALAMMAESLRAGCSAVLAANAIDMSAARASGMSEGLLDRLMLDEQRVHAMADALESLAELPDPVGKVLESRVLGNGLKLRKVSVPLGVVAMVYEARPNVTADAAGICIRSGNAVVLRGGSSAINSNICIARLLSAAVGRAGLPAESIGIVSTPDRSATDALMRMRGLVDVLIPRGGAGLIRACVEHSLVPVIETGVGNCHVYVDASADFDMARSIILNAKTQRPGVCNACESILVDASVAEAFLPSCILQLVEAGVLVHGDSATAEIVQTLCPPFARERFVEAVDEDWGREYLALEVSIKVVSGVDGAIAHIARYGTHHSECIVASDRDAVDKFMASVDAAAVYANASTRFTDGGCFGLGAEIGISTQKLHVRGPFAAEALTTYKYLISGTGQVRR